MKQWINLQSSCGNKLSKLSNFHIVDHHWNPRKASVVVKGLVLSKDKPTVLKGDFEHGRHLIRLCMYQSWVGEWSSILEKLLTLTASKKTMRTETGVWVFVEGMAQKTVGEAVWINGYFALLRAYPFYICSNSFFGKGRTAHHWTLVCNVDVDIRSHVIDSSPYCTRSVQRTKVSHKFTKFVCDRNFCPVLRLVNISQNGKVLSLTGSSVRCQLNFYWILTQYFQDTGLGFVYHPKLRTTLICIWHFISN